MKECLTKQLLFREISGCLVEKPECGYAHKFGFSFECHHPDHTKFHVHAGCAEAKDGIDELYDTLKRKRRDEFIATLDETSKRYFSI
ncbi:MAG: hypothetical protein PHD54_00845 [Desulfuromonadaceae bacterium]|nr:hypothetical protein [Desulfuromonadaceae bacterium]